MAHIYSILSLSYCRYSLTASSLKQEYQYLCIISTIIHLCNDLYSFLVSFHWLSCIIQFQQPVVALALYSCMEEALHQIRCPETFWPLGSTQPFSECGGNQTSRKTPILASLLASITVFLEENPSHSDTFLRVTENFIIWIVYLMTCYLTKTLCDYEGQCIWKS